MLFLSVRLDALGGVGWVVMAAAGRCSSWVLAATFSMYDCPDGLSYMNRLDVA